jgi:hypothetical protein
MSNFFPTEHHISGRPKPERRTINGIEYIVDYHPCTCSCHSTGAIHFMACCNGGWVEYLRRADEEPNDNVEINDL